MLLLWRVFDVGLNELIEGSQEEVGFKLTQAPIQSLKLVLPILIL